VVLEFSEALRELERVFGIMQEEYRLKELVLPSDTTKIMRAMRSKSAGA
jgi:hypothetical protein